MPTSTTRDPNFKGRIIVVDDEAHQRLILEQAIQSLGYEVEPLADGHEALKKIRFGHYDVLITDLQMSGMDGLRLLENTRLYDPSVSVIVVTAHGSIETAVDAIRKGAEDYLLKPVEFSALDLILEKTFDKRKLVRENKKLLSENEALKRDLGIKYHLANTIGKSEASQKITEQVKKYIKTRDSVVILGEPGTGKAEIAKMLHYNSPWATNSLIEFDCQAVPSDLQEIHLFGTGMAVTDGQKQEGRPGLVEKAHLGVLLLENIHVLNKSCQSRLSRVLREDKTQRVGTQVFSSVNVRVIATCTAEDFKKAVDENDFRPDVYDLLMKNRIDLVPLRERCEDIPVLIAAFTKRMSTNLGKEITKVDKQVLETLSRYDFPGNSKELESLVESAVIRCPDTILKIEHFGTLAG